MQGYVYEAIELSTQRPDGKLLTYSTYRRDNAELSWETLLKDLPAYSITGERIDERTLVERLQKESSVLFAYDEKPDPFYLRLLKDTAVVIVIPRLKFCPKLSEMPLLSEKPNPPTLKERRNEGAWKQLIIQEGYRAMKLQKLGPALCVDATFNGLPALLQVDTGAFETHLATDRSPGSTLKWRVTNQPFVSAGNLENSPTQESDVSDFKLGEFQKVNFKIEGVDARAAQYLRWDTKKLGGILGLDLLKEMAGVIDFNEGVLYYRPKIASSEQKNIRLPGLSDHAVIDLKWKWYTLTLDGTVDGKLVSLGIDSGYGESVLARDGPVASNLVWYKPPGTAPHAKKGGDFTFTNLGFAQNDFARLKMHGLNMNYIYDSIKLSKQHRLDGLLGETELEKISGILDCGNAVLYYIPVKDGKPK
jgi:hypothetical protein